MAPPSILFVVNSSLASPTGGGRTRVISEAVQVTQRGSRVTILCFFRPQQAFQPRFLRFGRRKLAEESGCTVVYAPRLPFTRFVSVNWLNVHFCSLVVLLLALIQQSKVIHGHGFAPSIFALVARRYHRNCYIVADIHGLSLEEAVYSGSLRQNDPLLQRYLSHEEQVLSEADWLIFVSVAMRTHFEAKYSRCFTNSSVIPCATEGKFHLDEESRQMRRQSAGLHDKFVLCYVGSAVQYQLVQEMISLYRELRARLPNAFFLIVSHYEQSFRQALESAGIDDDSFRIIAVDHEEVFRQIQVADIGLLLRDDSTLNRVASPTKFAEYLLCGLPVVITPYVGDMSDMAERYHVGKTIDLQEPLVSEELMAFILRVETDRMEYARRCASFAKENFSWAVYGDQLAEIYSNATNAIAND